MSLLTTPWLGRRRLAGPLTAAACALALSVAAAQETPDPLPWGTRASLRLDVEAWRAGGASDALVRKVEASPLRYFRLLAPQFSDRTCFAFRDLRWRLPSAAVHGDAHVEQFVVTGQTYGLEDYDRAGYGPAVVDLVRYAASLHVLCRQAKFRCDADAAVKAYLRAYRAALDREIPRVPPPIVARLRATTPQDPRAWLEWTSSLMQPLPSKDTDAMHREWRRFVQLMRETRPDRPETFYRIVRAGSIDIGIGSALEPKRLIRIDGATESPDDDVILEARTTAMPSGRECIMRAPNGGSLHVLLFTAILGPRMPDVFGFLPQEGAREAPELWVQSWDRGYHELSVSDLESQADLEALAVDAAHQLAGHFWTRFPEPLRVYQRFAQLRAFEMTERRAERLARELADETVTEWERFKKAVARPSH
jgi:hypothetical protein